MIEGRAAERIDPRVHQLFALVPEALARATDSLLSGDPSVGQEVVDDDEQFDTLTAEVEALVWQELDSGAPEGATLRYLVSVLLMLSELERSADLAEHIAQRAVTHLGAEMSPVSRGIVQQMTDVAIAMWQAAADAFGDRSTQGPALNEADEEIDRLHGELTREVAAEAMAVPVAAQVTLLGRFYERLGDHAVNLARRVERLSAQDWPGP